MIVGLVAGLVFGKPAYYLSLLWCCAAIFIFMVSGIIYLHLVTISLVYGFYFEKQNYCDDARRLIPVLCFPSKMLLKFRVVNKMLSNLFCARLPQIRTLRLKLLSEAAAEGKLVRGARNQLRMYLTMAIAAAQPVFMYWLTFHLIR